LYAEKSTASPLSCALINAFGFSRIARNIACRTSSNSKVPGYELTTTLAALSTSSITSAVISNFICSPLLVVTFAPLSTVQLPRRHERAVFLHGNQFRVHAGAVDVDDCEPLLPV